MTAHREWGKRDDALLRKLYPCTSGVELAARLGRRVSSVYSRAYTLGLRKDREAYRAQMRKVAADPNHPGRAARFQKGHASWNKGMKGWQPGGAAVKNQFKPGHRPHTLREIGAMRVSDGFLYVKLTDTGYVPHDWAPVHVLLFQSLHGPVPPGHVVTFQDGNRRNFADSNLVAISRAENMKRNSIHTQLPPSLKSTVIALGQLKRRIREREEKHQ